MIESFSARYNRAVRREEVRNVGNSNLIQEHMPSLYAKLVRSMPYFLIHKQLKYEFEKISSGFTFTLYFFTEENTDVFINKVSITQAKQYGSGAICIYLATQLEEGAKDLEEFIETMRVDGFEYIAEGRGVIRDIQYATHALDLDFANLPEREIFIKELQSVEEQLYKA